MTSYLENKLELLNASQRKLDEEKHAIEEQIILEIKKKSALEMDGTIVKFETQLNELKKYIEGDIFPNNIQIVHQYNKDYNDGCNKFITLEKFKDNLSKIDDTTIKKANKKFVEIKPEIKIYDDIIPIFSTMIGIMKKQQEEIKELQSKHKSSYIIPGVVH